MKPQRKRTESPEAAERRAGINRGRKEVAEGKGVAHEKVREWLLGLASGKKKSRPNCK